MYILVIFFIYNYIYIIYNIIIIIKINIYKVTCNVFDFQYIIIKKLHIVHTHAFHLFLDQFLNCLNLTVLTISPLSHWHLKLHVLW